MIYSEAAEKYKEQFMSGRKKGCEIRDFGFPFGNMYKDEYFVTVYVPTNMLSPRPKIDTLVNEYVDVDEPVWLSVGTKLKNGDVILHHDAKIQILDGNHRIAAKKRNNCKEIKATLPMSHYLKLKCLKVKKDGSLYN